MIVFDLICGQQHVFEAWFGDSADYEDQRARQLIACPYCQNTGIDKAVMAPNVTAKSNQRQQVAAPTAVMNTPTQTTESVPSPAQMKEFLRIALAMQKHVETTHEDVGEAFPEEVRKIHYGEAVAKPIYGLADRDEVQALTEEGIELLPLPFPRRRTRKQLDA